jgi:hypothetical protein
MRDAGERVDGRTSPVRRFERKRAVLPIAAACLLLLSGCYTFSSPIGVPLPTVKRFDLEFRNYTRLDANKSIAVAGDTAEIYVSGYAHREVSEQAAIDAALVACEARRRDRRVAAPCRTYAIGDRTVETAGLQTESLVR